MWYIIAPCGYANNLDGVDSFQSGSLDILQWVLQWRDERVDSATDVQDVVITSKILITLFDAKALRMATHGKMD